MLKYGYLKVKMSKNDIHTVVNSTWLMGKSSVKQNHFVYKQFWKHLQYW